MGSSYYKFEFFFSKFVSFYIVNNNEHSTERTIWYILHLNITLIFIYTYLHIVFTYIYSIFAIRRMSYISNNKTCVVQSAQSFATKNDVSRYIRRRCFNIRSGKSK